jgi:taurine dioxygenase
MRIAAATAPLGARIDGVDLRAGLSEASFAEIEAAFDRHGVIAISDQHLGPAELVAFSRRFGPLEISVATSFRDDAVPEVTVLSNRKRADGKYVGSPDAGQGWHADLSYNDVPSRASILHAHQVPMRGGKPLGDTLFCGTAAAYEALDPALRERLKGLRAVHDFAKFYDYMIREKQSTRPPLTSAQRAEKPPVVHPLVLPHPRTGRLCLYADPGYTTRILGLSPTESDALLEFLFAHQTRAEFQYRHQWRVGDVLIWDNIATIHMATGGYRDDEPRHMLRAQVLGDPRAYRGERLAV